MQLNQRTEKCTELFSVNERLLIVTFLKEIEPVVTERHRFDRRDEPFSVTNFWKTWTNLIAKQGSISMVSQLNRPLVGWGCHLIHFWMKLACNHKKLGDWFSIKKHKISITECVRILMQRNQLTDIWIDFFSLVIRFRIANPMNTVNPVVKEKHLFDDPNDSFPVTNFWEIWTNMIVMQESKPMVSQSNLSLKEWGFRLMS